jgi:hypothetical protein
MQVWIEILLSFLAGALLIGGVAKLFTPLARIPWPVNSGILRLPLGPRLAGGVELAALMLIWLGSASLAAGVAAVGYAVLTAAGWLLRGQRCGCFGPIRLTVIGPAHLVLNAVGMCLSAGLLGLSLTLPTEPRSSLAQRAAAIAIASGLVYVGLWLSGRLRASKERQAEPCRDMIGSVHLYVSQDCPACRALEILLAGMETDRRAKVTVSRVGRHTSLPRTLAHLGVPCAVPLSPASKQVCTPVSGLAATIRHIQAITLATRTGTDSKQLH